MVENSKKRRSWYHIVNKKLQLKYLKFVTLAIFVSMSVVWLSVYANFYVFKKFTALSSYETEVLNYLFLERINYYFIAEIIIFVILGAVFSLFISHKIAGPLYRIEKEIRNLTEGGADVKKINLRKGDELEELAGLINKLIDKTQK